MSPRFIAAFRDGRWYLSNVWRLSPEEIVAFAEAILREQGKEPS